MMRLRVYAQAFTFVALVGVPLYKGYFLAKERRAQRLLLQEQFEQQQAPEPEVKQADS